MIYNWYNIFNFLEFQDTGLVSRNLTVALADVGVVEIMITQANLVSILYDGVFLPVELEGMNPYKKDGYAVYKDANNDVWLGIEVVE